MYLTICAILIVILIYRYAIRPMFYWKERGVPYQKPWPIFGNMGATFFKRKSMFEQAIDFYREYPEKRYNGIFQFTKPVLLIRDLDLLKDILIKDFDHFTDHYSMFTEDVEQLMGRNLFALKGQKWRETRAAVSPSFTGSKMRFMFDLMSENVERFSAHLEKKASKTLYVAELKDLYTRFTNDVIASVMFGYNCDSIAEPENEFYLMGKRATNFTGWQFMKRYLANTTPFFSKLKSSVSLHVINVLNYKWLNLGFFPKDLNDFFQKVVNENIEKREKSGIVRPDMIQILMDARSGRSRYQENHEDNSISQDFATVQETNFDAKPQSDELLTKDDIIAQAFVFFSSGFDSIANLMSFVSYELALNVDVQEKLQAEIDDTLGKCGGKITYDALLSMKYLDMVISETLRRWTPGFQLDRDCLKDYVIKPVNGNEKPLLVEKGTSVLIPVAGIHMDPKIYRNPEKFDPERFSDENKDKIPPFAYMPFGLGPRNCIASRFTLLENKTLIFHMLSKFTITVVEKTPIPLVLGKSTFSMLPDEGFWLGFKLRKPLRQE